MLRSRHHNEVYALAHNRGGCKVEERAISLHAAPLKRDTTLPGNVKREHRRGIQIITINNSIQHILTSTDIRDVR